MTADILELSQRLEKEIMYFISTYSVDFEGKYTFCWPVLPHPAMGKEFCSRVTERNIVIADWIKNNPEKFKTAQNSYFKDPKT